MYDLLSGKSINIEKDDELITIFILLKNKELIESMETELTIDNLYEQITRKSKLSMNIDKEIEFGASHFEEIKQNDKFSLSQWIAFVSSNKLKLSNEKSLLDFIMNKINDDKQYFILLKFIHCEFLEDEDIC